MHENTHIIFATSSAIRKQMFQNANVSCDYQKPLLDEEQIKESLIVEDVSPRDISDALAEAKARKISYKNPNSVVIGSDQTLSLHGKLISKARSKEEALNLLKAFSGERHNLFSAAVIYENAKPVWRQVNQVKMTMSSNTAEYLADYVERNWQEIQYCVGAYMFEKEGIRLFSKIEGDYFSILGMPMLETLSYLKQRGFIKS